MSVSTTKASVSSCALLGLSLSLWTVRLPAQSVFATITGSVTDATGAVVAGASVSAIHLSTNLKATAKTNEVGVYTLANLREGEFRLEAGASGFKDLALQGISLVSGELRRVDLSLQVGGVQERVEISAAAGLIETDTARISDVRSDREMNMIGKNASTLGVWAYMSISPMVTASGSTTPSFAGSKAGQFVISFDGTNTDNGSGSPIGSNTMVHHWVQEMKIDYANNSAEHGQLVQLSLVSKSGGNDLHGMVYDYYSSPGFRAKAFFAAAPATGVSHTPGLDIGGPVYIPKIYNGKNRTFWFIGAQRATFPGTAALSATVPLESWRNGDFSGLGVPIRNPFTGEIYSNGIIPATAINPISKKIQDRFYPLPNFGNSATLQSNNFRQTLNAPQEVEPNLVMRLDQKLGGRDYLYASYIFDNDRIPAWEGNLPSFGPRQQLRQQKVINITHAHTFRPTLLNEFRFGHGVDFNNYQGPLNGPEVVRSLGIQGLAPNLPDIGGVFNVAFSGVGLQGISQITQNKGGPKSQHVQDQVSYFRGRHSFKFGAEIGRYFPIMSSSASCLFGCVTFANTYSQVPGVPNSGSAYADFLFGVPTSASRNFAPLTVQPRRWTESFFVTDSWKVTQRLTLNLGLRYEYTGTWSEVNGLMSLFDASSGKIVVPDGSVSKVSPLMPASYVSVVAANSVSLPNSLIRGDKNNFGPRFGLAYRPFGNTTVFRGGYGIYYNTFPSQPTTAGVPFSISEPTYTNTAGTPSLVLPQAFPGTGAGGPSTVGLPSAINPNVKVPYSEQWNVTVEHERWGFGFRASYVGTVSRQMVFNYNLNSPVVDGQLFINKPRPFPNYPGINYTTNGANHNYHGMGFAVQRRLKSGLQLESSYTWARDIGDDVSSLENPFDLRRERAVNQFVPTQRLVSSILYELPFGRGRKWMSGIPRWVSAVVGGWNLSVLTIFQTGQFLTPTVSIPDPTGTTFTGSANRPQVTIRPDVLRNPNTGNFSDPATQKWFDVNAFAAPPIGSFGNSSRGLVIGPGENVFTGGLEKQIVFSDNPRMPRLRLDLYAQNMFNHPNWANPSTNLSNPGLAGQITSDGGVSGGSAGDHATSRTMRCAIRLEW